MGGVIFAESSDMVLPSSIYRGRRDWPPQGSARPFCHGRNDQSPTSPRRISDNLDEPWGLSIIIIGIDAVHFPAGKFHIVEMIFECSRAKKCPSFAHRDAIELGDRFQVVGALVSGADCPFNRTIH